MNRSRHSDAARTSSASGSSDCCGFTNLAKSLISLHLSVGWGVIRFPLMQVLLEQLRIAPAFLMRPNVEVTSCPASRARPVGCRVRARGHVHGGFLVVLTPIDAARGPWPACCVPVASCLRWSCGLPFAVVRTWRASHYSTLHRGVLHFGFEAAVLNNNENCYFSDDLSTEDELR